jgi:poly-beta-hydroxybutyrate-responsive repressor
MRDLRVLDSRLEDHAECRCEGGQPKNFTRPCLLLLLAEAPAHGYELIDRLRPFGFEIADPATVYKSLRQMEHEGLVTSGWELSERGPARRVYSLAEDGRDLLDAWAHTLDRNRMILDHFEGRYLALRAPRVDVPPRPATTAALVGGEQ